MRYSTAIFDLDGTLLNTIDDLAASTNYALARHGLPARTTPEVQAFVGNGIRNLIRQAVPAGSDDRLIEAVHRTFDAHYAAHDLDATLPYPGIVGMLDRLRARGVSCCVVSNKGDFAVQPLIRHFFPGLFDVVCGEREREGIRRKPWPDTVLACMQQLGAAPESCAYVGDSDVDIKTAANAAIDCIVVTWGFRDEAFLRAQGATTLAHSVQELERALLGS